MHCQDDFSALNLLDLKMVRLKLALIILLQDLNVGSKNEPYV